MPWVLWIHHIALLYTGIVDGIYAYESDPRKTANHGRHIQLLQNLHLTNEEPVAMREMAMDEHWKNASNR